MTNEQVTATLERLREIRRNQTWRLIDCDICYAIAGELCRVLDDNGHPTGTVKTQPHHDRIAKALSYGPTA